LAIDLPNKIDHIAVMRLSAMGDVAMTVPVLRVSKSISEIKITVISRPFFKAFEWKSVSFEFDESPSQGVCRIVALVPICNY
jgi:hypothetical protein